MTDRSISSLLKNKIPAKAFSGILPRAGLMILFGAALQIFSSNILTYYLEAANKTEEYEQIVSPLLTMEPAMILRVVVIAPFLEELFFRGAVFFLFRCFLFLLTAFFTGSVTNPGGLSEIFRQALLSGSPASRKHPADPLKRSRITAPPSASKILSIRREKLIGISANFLQAAFFGLYHGNVYQGVYAFLIGYLFGTLALSFHTIGYGILAHASVNFFGLYLDRFLPDKILAPAEFVLTVGSVFIIAGILYYAAKKGPAE